MYLLSSADPAAVPWKRDHPYQIFPSVLTGSRQPKLSLESFLCPLKQSPLSLLMLSSSPRGPPAPSSLLGQLDCPNFKECQLACDQPFIEQLLFQSHFFPPTLAVSPLHPFLCRTPKSLQRFHNIPKPSSNGKLVFCQAVKRDQKEESILLLTLIL